MAMTKCKECKNEISTTAESCPKCGAKIQGKVGIGSVIGGIFIAGLFVWYFFAGGIEHQADQNLKSIENQVADDAVAQYRIAQKSGTKIDICAHAGFVAAAFLQAKDEKNYKAFKAEEKTVCKAAGMPVEQ